MKVLSLLLRNTSKSHTLTLLLARLNESPELIAQECKPCISVFTTTACLNESPELIAQESVGLGVAREEKGASMKVLSLLLRNPASRRMSSRLLTGLNESPELIAQEYGSVLGRMR